MQTAELRKLSVTDLKTKLAESREVLFSARFKHATAQLEDTASLPKLKREIARLLTVLTEKEKEA